MISWSVRIGAEATSATCLLILVGLKFPAVNVILVGLDVRLPLLRQIIHHENGCDRTDRYTGAAINALSGIDVQLRHFIEGRSAILIGSALCRMDTIHRAHIHAGRILGSDAGLGNNVCHRALLRSNQYNATDAVIHSPLRTTEPPPLAHPMRTRHGLLY